MKYLILALLVISCSKNAPDIKTAVEKVVNSSNSKFNVGDCVTRTFTAVETNNEFSENKKETIRIDIKIVNVGKRNYQVDFGGPSLGEKEIKFVDKYYQLINCSQADI
jgi:biotin synthase-related radical SAM superfamily protein